MFELSCTETGSTSFETSCRTESLSPNDLVRAASAPCLLFREEDTPSIREKVDAYPWARTNERRLLNRTRSRVADPVRIPDRGGQWPHWYACQSCGAQLVTESPTVHRCSACDLVNSGEPWDSVPLTRIHNRLSEDVRDLGVSYALTSERPFAEKAAKILLGYSEVYPRYEIRDHYLNTDSPWATKVSWGTLGESVWLIPVCIGYDLIRHAGVLTPAEHQTIREQLLRPAAKLILKHNIGIHNIQCWHDCAIGMAALMLRDPELLAFAVDGEVGIREQISRGVLADGFWHEGSWGYHFYGMTPILSWLIALRNCGLDLFEEIQEMFAAPLRAVRPDGGMPTFHDSDSAPRSTSSDKYEIALSAYGDARYALPIKDQPREGLNALLFGVAELPEDPDPESVTEHLESSGFIYSRQGKGQTYFAFDYGPHGGGHGHPDKLGFTLFARGKTQAPDPGSVAYGIPIPKQWFTQTVSHNTVVVDGHSQKPATGSLQFLVRSRGADVMQADAGEIYKGVRHIRSVVVTDDVVLLIDRLRSEKTHTYDWVYHNRGMLRTGFSRRSLKRPLEEAAGYEVIQDLRRGRPEDAWRATWKQDGSGVRLTAIGSKDPTDVYTGCGPANVDGSGIGFEAEDVPLVIARRSGRRRTTFASALQIFGAHPDKDSFEPVSLDKPQRGRAYRYTSSRQDLTFVVSLSAGFLACDDVRFKGAAAMVDHLGGRVLLCLGNQVACFGHEIRVDPIGSLEVSRDDMGLRVQNLSTTSLEISVDDRSTSLPADQTWRLPSD